MPPNDAYMGQLETVGLTYKEIYKRGSDKDGGIRPEYAGLRI